MRVSRYGDTFVVRVDEEEYLTPQLLEEAFKSIIEKMQHDALIVDMHRVKTITSLGIAVIIATQGLAMVHRRRIAFAGVQPGVRRSLELVGADAILALYPTLEDAARSISG